MSLSIRNQLPGTITAITRGEAMATLKIHLSGGQPLTAAITLDALKYLALTEETPVTALVKATDISLATTPIKGLSIRNQLPGTITGIATGPAMTSVKIAVDGAALTAAITTDATTDLALTPGMPVTALIKATEVALTTT